MQPAFEAEVISLWSEGPGHHFVAWDRAERRFSWDERGRWTYAKGQMPREGESPTADDWEIFWRILDEIGAWEWHGAQNPHLICDGGDWCLRVEHAGRSIEATGVYVTRKPRFFDLFERSLHALAGIPRRGSSVLSIQGEQPVIERLTDLFLLAGVVGAAIKKSPSAVPLLRQSIEDNQSSGYVLLEILDELGPLKAEILPVLLARLEGVDEQASWNLRALATFGSHARQAIPFLLDRLEARPDWRIYEAVRAAIIAIAPDDARLRARLPRLLSHRKQVLKLAGLAFQNAAPSFQADVLEALAQTFDSDDPYVLDSAAGTLQSMEVNRPELLRFLQRPVQDCSGQGSTLIRHCLSQPRIRHRFIHLLAGLGEGARGELSQIADLLRDPEPAVRQAAVFAVARIAPREEAVALVRGMLADPEHSVRQFVSQEFPELANRRDPLPALIKIVESADEPEADAAMSAICKKLGDPDEIVSRFEPLLKHNRPQTRSAAMKAISRCRGESWQRVEMLLRMLGDENSGVRVVAIGQLQGLHGELARLVLPAFCDALLEPATCPSAAAAISSLREDGLPAIPVLNDLLESGQLEGLGKFCVARTLYELSPEYAARLTPEEVESLTRFGCHPIWTRDEACH
jgi:HEAT repeat protein